MFNLDARLQARIARHVERVLVVDPNLASTYLLADLLKGIGAQQCAHASTTKRALQICVEKQPQLIFVEFNGPSLNGVEFTSRLRRSSMVARTAPVILITSDTRESSIKAARDAGAHEFLCKPFTAANVFRRVQNVTLKPRPWVEASHYVGPDRRRFNSGQYEGAKKRTADVAPEAAAELAFVDADVSIRSQLSLIDSAPQIALRHIMEQTFELQKAAGAWVEEDELSRAIGSLQKYLVNAIDQDSFEADTVETHLDLIGSLRHVAPRPPSSASLF